MLNLWKMQKCQNSLLAYRIHHTHRILASKDRVLNRFLTENDRVIHSIGKHLDSLYNKKSHAGFERMGRFEYFSKRSKGRTFPDFYRRQSRCRSQMLVLDVSTLCRWNPRLIRIVTLKPSSDNDSRYIGFSADFAFENHTKRLLFVKDLFTNVIAHIDLSLFISPSSYVADFEWFYKDGAPILCFSTTDTKNRPFQVWRLDMNTNLMQQIYGSEYLTQYKRKHQVMKSSRLDPPQSGLQRIYCEADPAFYVNLSCAGSKTHLFISSHSKVTSDISLLPLADCNATPLLLWDRKIFARAFPAQAGNYFYLVTDLHIGGDGGDKKELIMQECDNVRRGDYRMLRVSTSDMQNWVDCSKSLHNMLSWEPFWPPSHDQLSAQGLRPFLRDFDVFSRSILLYGRTGTGKSMIQWIDCSVSTGGRVVDVMAAACTDLLSNMKKILDGRNYSNLQNYSQVFSEGVLDVTPSLNADADAEEATFKISSPIFDEIVFRVDLSNGDVSLTSDSESLSGHFKGGVSISTMIAQSRDGVAIPVTLLRSHKQQEKGGISSPLLLVGYGAYGVPLQQGYSPKLFHLLDKGWSLAFAKVRGGGDFGSAWHDAGKGLYKWNTFYDFASCAQMLLDTGHATTTSMCMMVESAGGLIGGVMANHFPNLFAGIVMRSPFLDLTSAMLRPQAALTVHEYDEWGDPNVPEVLNYMNTYCPKVNIRRQKYPKILIATGSLDEKIDVNDVRRWVDCVNERHIHERNETTDGGEGEDPVLLHIFKAGHDGPTTVEEQLSTMAVEIAFLESCVRI